jgi:beta-galactosidase
MYNIIKGKYFPFGSQYYRAPSPHEREWEKDLKTMSSLGFNSIKFWIQWRWNNPEERKYYFKDIDKLMDLAHKYKLRVMLNTIFDVAPAWIFQKYPDATMVTLGGKSVGPQTQPHRQIGGLGYCFNHTGVMKHFFEFLEITVNRYKDHPALEIWNIGSEPELTSSMAEMRLFASDAGMIDDMLCYCSNCVIGFKKWLKIKYKNIHSLNKSWNRNYYSFEQVEVPRTRNTFNDLIDWRMFFVSTIGENVKQRFETARRIDKGKHPLMCHHVFIQGFPITSTANDPWNIGQYGDLHGFTQMDDAMMIDILRSCAKGKPVISAEMLMLMGYTLDLPKYIDANDIKRHIFSGIAGNLKGFIFWQYRPEILGREAPAWGLTYPDGSETPWLRSFSEIGKVLQKNSKFLLKAFPPKAEIALLYNPENMIFSWVSTGTEETAIQSLLGYHKSLYNSNYSVDFVHPMEIKNNILKKYKVLIIPFSYVIDKDLCNEIKVFVKNGGVLVGEANFAGWNMENGHHEKIIPGYGLNKVFKCRQGLVEPPNTNTVVKFGILKDYFYKRLDNKIKDQIVTEFLNVTGNSIISDQGGVRIILRKDMEYIFSNDQIRGSLIKETLIPEGAEVIAEFDTGEPAITVAEYGKGKAVLIGSYIGLVSHEANAKFISSLIEFVSNVKKTAEVNEKVRVDVLGNDEVMVIIRNLTIEHIHCSIKVPINKVLQLKEQFSGETINTNVTGDGAYFSVKLDSKEVKVFCA